MKNLKETTQVILSKRISKFGKMDYLFKKENTDVYNTICNMFNDNMTFIEKVYCIVNELSEIPICSNCGKNKLKFIDMNYGYREFCCRNCMNTSKKILDKRSRTNMKKYGSVCPLNNKEVKQKAVDTWKKNYGDHVTNPGQLGKSRQTNIAIYYDKLCSDNIRNGNNTPLFALDDMLNRDKVYSLYSFKCNVCGNIFDTAVANGRIPRCFNCNPLEPGSNAEREIYEYIKSVCSDRILKNNRSVLKKLELDIYMPGRNIAIEYNGCFWHNEIGKDRNYHLKKTEACAKNNIQLYHIFENEWNSYNEQGIVKRAIWKSIISNMFGCNDRIYARNCIVKNVPAKDKKMFLEENHLQGNDNSKYRLGLYHDDVLVSLMTFGKPRFNSNYEYELIRFCNRKFTSIAGGASRLLKHFITDYNPVSIISYADRRYSAGNLYEKLGMKHVNNTVPGYIYCQTCHGNTIDVLSRYQCQKHKLAELFKENYGPELSEHENMKNNKYYRMYDCGNMVFEWKKMT